MELQQRDPRISLKVREDRNAKTRRLSSGCRPGRRGPRREVSGGGRLRRRVRRAVKVAAGLRPGGRTGEIPYALRTKHEHRAGARDGQIQQAPANDQGQPREPAEGDPR